MHPTHGSEWNEGIGSSVQAALQYTVSYTYLLPYLFDPARPCRRHFHLFPRSSRYPRSRRSPLFS